MFFSCSHFQAGWNQSVETKLRYSGAQKNIFCIPLLLVLRGGEVMAVGRYVPQISKRIFCTSVQSWTKITDGKFRPRSFVWLHPWLRNELMGVGFSVPFFRCKIVAECFCHQGRVAQSWVKITPARVSAKFEFKYESLWSKYILTLFVNKLMIQCSMNIRENCLRKCFWTKEKGTRVKFNPGLSANQPSNIGPGILIL